MARKNSIPMNSRPPPVLSTNIQLPRAAAELIERPRLLDLLPTARTKLLSVIKGPAGFAKTSVALAWARALESPECRVAWVTLDPNDDVPTRLLFSAVQALRLASEGLGASVIAMISENSLLPIETPISVLINELAELDEDVFLFLDDYHYLSEPAIHHGLSFFLRNAPRNFHLVLTSRSDPPLPLPRLRAQNQLFEVDATELRFDLSETDRLLSLAHKVVSPSDVERLHSMTGGWPAALRLATSTSSHTGGGLASYLRSRIGLSPEINDYIEDLIGTLPAALVSFMLRTSILDRFNASLCDAVTNTRSSQELLVSVRKSQLLMTRLGGQEQWYTYHPLLSEFLKTRLQSRYLYEVPELNRRAARWYASGEMWMEAVEHALAAGDMQEGLRWVEKCAMDLVKRGELLTLLGWQRRLPSDIMRGQMRVRLAIAWGMALAMRFEETLALLTDIESDLVSATANACEEIATECQTIRSVVIALQDDSSGALALAEPCLQPRNADPWNANVASNVMRFGHWKAGNLEAFYGVPWIPYSMEDDTRNLLADVYRLCLQGFAELQQLRFGVAERHYLDALRRSEEQVGKQSTAAALPASLIAQLRYEQGRLDEAEAMISDRLPTINGTAMLECVLTAHIVLARIAAGRSNIEHAYALLEQAVSLGYSRRWRRLCAAVEVERVRLYLGEGRLTEASASLAQLDRLVDEYPAFTRCAWSEISEYRSLAKSLVALAGGRPGDAVDALRGLRRDALSTHRHYFAVRVDTMLSAALLEAGKPAEAVELLQDVVKRAAPAGIYRTLVDAGPEIGSILPRLRENIERKGRSDDLLAYLDHVLDGWRATWQPNREQQPGPRIAETLAPRERTVLELIGEGRSNKEIARLLGIAPETVKSHVKRIFEKLSVGKRAQAIARAQSLGLLRMR
jgi:LuxR family transcriptional regulator, maltose regulon positive regulatory protein